MTRIDYRVPCRQCGHNAHSESLGCPNCLPGLGCGLEPDQPEDWPTVRGPGSEDAIDMADFTVGPLEVLCSQCHLIHRPGQECP